MRRAHTETGREMANMRQARQDRRDRRQSFENPRSGEVTDAVSLTVVVDNDYPNPREGTVRYEQREDGWYVNPMTIPSENRGWRRFAQKGASPRTVEQLIRKEWDDRY